MKNKNITIKNVAKIAGVSFKTVSRVINNERYIKEETRKKVLEIINKVNYKPNYLAKSFASGKSNTIGYIVPDFMNQFFGLVFNGLEEELKKMGFNIIVIHSNGNEESEKKCIDVLISNRVEGIVLASDGLIGTHVVEQSKVYKIPFVLINNKLKNAKMNCILHDNINGARILTEHLIKIHSCKSIAYIGGNIDETFCNDRLEGYRKSLLENGISIKDDLIKIGNWWDTEKSYFLLKELFKQRNKPSAIFVANSSMLTGIVKAIRELDLKIPEDISIVTFAKLDILESIYCNFTSLKKVEKKIGEEAAKLISKKIKNKDINNFKEIYVKMTIEIGKSCGCNGTSR